MTVEHSPHAPVPLYLIRERNDGSGPEPRTAPGTAELARWDLATLQRLGARVIDYDYLVPMFHGRAIAYPLAIGSATDPDRVWPHDQMRIPGERAARTSAYNGWPINIVRQLANATADRYEELPLPERERIAGDFATEFEAMARSTVGVNRTFAARIAADPNVLDAQRRQQITDNLEAFAAGTLERPDWVSSGRSRARDVEIDGFSVPRLQSAEPFMTPEDVANYAGDNFVEEIADEDLAEIDHFFEECQPNQNNGTLGYFDNCRDALIVGGNSNPSSVIQMAYLVRKGGHVDVTDVDVDQVRPLQAQIEALAAEENGAEPHTEKEAAQLAEAHQVWDKFFDAFEARGKRLISPQFRRMTARELVEKCRFSSLNVDDLGKDLNKRLSRPGEPTMWDVVRESSVIDSFDPNPSRFPPRLIKLRHAARRLCLCTRILGRDGWGGADGRKFRSLFMLPDDSDRAYSPFEELRESQWIGPSAALADHPGSYAGMKFYALHRGPMPVARYLELVVEPIGVDPKFVPVDERSLLAKAAVAAERASSARDPSQGAWSTVDLGTAVVRRKL